MRLAPSCRAHPRPRSLTPRRCRRFARRHASHPWGSSHQHGAPRSRHPVAVRIATAAVGTPFDPTPTVPPQTEPCHRRTTSTIPLALGDDVLRQIVAASTTSESLRTHVARRHLGAFGNTHAPSSWNPSPRSATRAMRGSAAQSRPGRCRAGGMGRFRSVRPSRSLNQKTPSGRACASAAAKTARAFCTSNGEP